MSRAALSKFGSLALLFCVVGIGGCGKVKTSQVPGGGTLIRCSNGMLDCISRASKICGDDGYTILEGVSRPKLLGGSSSSYRSMAEMAELTIVCGMVEPEEPEEGTFQLPERTDAEPEESPAEAPLPAAVCTPGATQKCVGPGACDGGQVCLPDGRGFGACDCGGARESTSDPSSSGAPGASTSSGDPTSLRPAPSGDSPKKAPEIPGQMPAAEPL